MYKVSENFKSAIVNNARYIKAYFIYNDVQYEIRTLNIEDNIYIEDKFIGTFIAKNGSITVNLNDSLNLENKEIDIYLGVKTVDDSIEYVPMGNYKVYEVVSINEFKIIDARYKFNVLFDASKLTYPITMYEILKEACRQADIELLTDDLPNKDLAVPSEVFFGYDATCADVVTAISQASCTFAKITRDNKLELKWFSNVDFPIDLKHQKKKPLVNDKFGVINSIVLAREPQNDNVYWPSEIEGDRVEFKISNNPILDIDRYTSIKEIHNRMNGFEYIPFNTESQGYFHLDCGDIAKLQKEDMTYINILIMNHSIKYSGGVSSVFETPALTKTQIDYSIASSIESKIYNTELKVDKVNNRITAEIKEVNTKIEKIGTPSVSVEPPENPQEGQQWIDITKSPPQYNVFKDGSWICVGDYTGDLGELTGEIERLNTSFTMQQGKIDFLIETNTIDIDGNKVTVKDVTSNLIMTIEGLKQSITTTGGNNIFEDTMGVFNNRFSVDGNVWDGSFNIDSSPDVKNRNIYGYALLLKNSNLKQTQRVPNGTYTVSFLYCKHITLANVKVIVNSVEITLDNNSYTKVETAIEVESNSLNIEFICDTDSACTICNLMGNQGNSPTVWSLAPGESWNDYVKIGRGIEIGDEQGNVTFNANARIIGFKNKSGEYVAVFTDVGAKMKEIEVTDRAVVCGTLIQQIGNQTVFNKVR